MSPENPESAYAVRRRELYPHPVVTSLAPGNHRIATAFLPPFLPNCNRSGVTRKQGAIRHICLAPAAADPHGSKTRTDALVVHRDQHSRNRLPAAQLRITSGSLLGDLQMAHAAIDVDLVVAAGAVEALRLDALPAALAAQLPPVELQVRNAAADPQVDTGATWT
jgi:hypothetical protein